MKKAIKWGAIILAAGLVIAGISYLGHRQPFNPLTPLEESSANQKVLTRKPFNKVKVTTSSADIVIKQGSTYSVSYYGENNQQGKVKVTNNQLTISQPTSKQNWFKEHLIFTPSIDRYVITVPKHTSLKSFNVNSKNSINVSGMRVKNANITNDTGNITINNCEFDQGQTITGSGNITVKNSTLLNNRLTSSSGDITLSNTSLTKGSATLASGDFIGKQLVIVGPYTVNNQSGDNTVTKSQVNGVSMTTQSGSNKLNRKSRDGGRLTWNSGQFNILYLKNASGDNTYK